MSDDDRRIYDMVARRFLAVFHPEAEFENTRVETTVAEHVFRTRGKVLLVPGWRGVYGELTEDEAPPPRRTRAATSSCPSSRRARQVDTREVASDEKETKPPRRYTDASLLGAMETAGKLVDDDELREAMKESGHRHAGHARRDHRAPDRRRLRRARRPRARADREGHERHPPARRPHADLARR